MNKFNEANSQSEPTDSPIDVGKLLRRTREASHLSVQSVSASLHLAPRIIIALEENDFLQFQPVFVKGYLRNYGRLLNVPVEPLIQAYTQIAEPEKALLQAPKQSSIKRKSPWAVYGLLTAILVLLLVWAVNQGMLPFASLKL